MEKNTLDPEEYNKLVNIIKKYTNLFKALYHVNPAAASEFKRKQEAYHAKHTDGHKHSPNTSGGCCGGENESNL